MRTAVRLMMLAACVAAVAGVSGTSGAVETQPAPDFDAEANRMEALTSDVTQGALRVVKPDGGVVECPLKHTGVAADIAGFVARVRVTQVFHNPLDEKIEAVYVFPLPHQAAVDEMTMVVGDRRVVGRIKRRAEARQIYEEALARGATAALLEQERPNIFTQSVGNIEPGQDVRIEIAYVDILEYDMGVYTFHFPMVVGPRYIPGGATSKKPPVPPELEGKVGELPDGEGRQSSKEPTGTGWSPDTNRVPDASRITPPVLKPGYRTGHDISLRVELDAGVPVQDLEVPNHRAEIERHSPSCAKVWMDPADSIPNKDFVLKYGVVGEKPAMAVLAHTEPGRGGSFMLMIQPSDDERLRQSPPREIVFLVDVSGSMSGRPTDKVREAMKKFLKRCKPQDTVQVVTFASQANKLFEKPLAVEPESIERALKFTEGIRGGGGTEMLKGVKMAIDEPADPKRVRIVIMLTDGYIGNEAEIIDEVGRRCGDRIRFWCLGIGQSPNRFLIDGVARQGGGMAKVLGLNDDPEDLVQEVMFRIHRAQLSDIEIEWGGLDVYETYPARVPELWAGRPVILFGRYGRGGENRTVQVCGLVEGEPASWPLQVTLPAHENRNEVLEKVWARRKIEHLMHTTYYAGSPEVEEAVTAIALDYGLMSQYTSFVAVDESKIGTVPEPARPPRRMLVPVPLPEGTRYEGFFGNELRGEALLAGSDVCLGIGGGGMEYKMAMPAMSAARPTAARGPGAADSRGWYGYRTGRRKAGAPAPRATLRRHARELREPFTMAGSGLFGGAFELGDIVGEFGGALVQPDGDKAYTSSALGQEGKELVKQAQDALEAAQALEKEGKLAEARARATLAMMLDASCQVLHCSDGETADKALELIETVDEAQRDAWAKDLPGLWKRLDLVIRNQPVAEALATVAKAAGLEVRLLDGSIADACALLGRRDLRVTYLDLRGATATEALDWILRPVRMTWWKQDGRVDAGTARRAPGVSAWVYDVSLIALPSQKDLQSIKDHSARIGAAKEAADAFLQAVHDVTAAGEDRIAWFAPGQVLLFADADTHVRAAQFFNDLADADASMEGPAANLHKTTCRRAAKRAAVAEEALALREKTIVAAAMRVYGWRLLAAAADGRLDMEALTELQVAWSRAEEVGLLAVLPANNRADNGQGQPAAAALRSLWCLTEAARALPLEKELAALATTVRDLAKGAADGMLEVFGKTPDDPATYLGVLYAALAMKDDAEYVARAMPLLAKARDEGSPLAPAPVVAQALLAPTGEVDAPALAAAVGENLRGDDLVALTALACRRAGGDAWHVFRAETSSVLSHQPLSGGVVVFVGNLSRPTLALADAKE